VYIELAVTLLVGWILISGGLVKPAEGVDKSDATLYNVLKAADRMQANILEAKRLLRDLKDAQTGAKPGALQQKSVHPEA
jgi:hypothetical protein